MIPALVDIASMNHWSYDTSPGKALRRVTNEAIIGWTSLLEIRSFLKPLNWTPAFAGVTSIEWHVLCRHSGGSRNPGSRKDKIPVQIIMASLVITREITPAPQKEKR